MKTLGFMILSVLASAILCFFSKEVFDGEGKLIVTMTVLTVAAIIFVIVTIVRFALHLIL